MKRHVLLAVVLAAVSGLAIVPSLRADDETTCSNASLRGAYGLAGDPNLVVGFGPTAALGSLTADGSGTWEGTLTQSFNGIIVHEAFTATYAVNSDCTGAVTLVLQPGGRAAHLSFVVLDQGNQVFVIETDSTAVASFVLKKQPNNACSNVHLKGAYGFKTRGTIVGVGPVSIVGSIIMDENGNVTGSQIKSLNGHITQDSFSGIYTAQPDCTGSATFIFQSDGSTSNFDFVVVGENNSVLRGIQADPNTAVTTLVERLSDDVAADSD